MGSTPSILDRAHSDAVSGAPQGGSDGGCCAGLQGSGHSHSSPTPNDQGAHHQSCDRNTTGSRQTPSYNLEDASHTAQPPGLSEPTPRSLSRPASPSVKRPASPMPQQSWQQQSSNGTVPARPPSRERGFNAKKWVGHGCAAGPAVQSRVL